MRRKYFIRGMGVGIVITVLVFTLASFFTRDTLSTSEIITKAKELGMVMPNENKSDDKQNNDDSKTEENVQTNEEGDKVTVQILTGDEVTPPPNETTDPTTEENNAAGENEDSKAVVFSVRSGENSSVVSANLYKKGLVKNPTEFNRFLESNGYDKNLKVGEYSIAPGSSEESIAKKLTGR